jgi:ubiquinone/menaquinone biosynthesis C-methylase UbiE
MRSLRSALGDQFGNPNGFLGRVAGFIMRVRPSNRERNLRTLALLDIQPADQVLEVGFGPGLAIERAAELASRGKVVGIDHSALMLQEARLRNAKAIGDGRVELLLGSADRVPDFGARFDKVFAVNVFMFWDNPIAVLRDLCRVMKPGGTISLTLQPRSRGATNADAREAAERMETAIRAADFENVRIEIFEMAPVHTACVLGRAPAGAPERREVNA